MNNKDLLFRSSSLYVICQELKFRPMRESASRESSMKIMTLRCTFCRKARITRDWKDNHLDQSSETSKVFKQSSTHMPPQTGVTLAKYAFFLWGWKPLKGDPHTSFDNETRPNQLLHQYSLFKLSKKSQINFSCLTQRHQFWCGV